MGVAYKAEHGHCRVPRNYVHDKALSLWVMSQRTRCTTATRRQQLTDLDFVWKIRKTNKTKTKKSKSTNTTHEEDGNKVAAEAVMTSWTNDKRTTADEHTHANDTNTNEDNKKRKTSSTDGITHEDDDDTTTTAKKKPKT